MIRLSENLYQFTDTCQVYVIRTGVETALLVDFGAGDVLDHLNEMDHFVEIGGPRITDVLMTHHHRDQGQGLARAVAAGIRIWAPHQEQDLFRAVDAHWQAREIYDNYNVRQDRFALLERVPIAGTLMDYATVHFGSQAFTVWPTPSHTPGSLTLLAEIDGRRVAFTGDLIAAPGQTWSLAATQWTYHGAEGVAVGLASLLELAEHPLDLLLPSHGAPMDAPGPAMDLLARRLRALLDLRGENPRLGEVRAHPYVAVTPHVLWNRTSESKSYVLLSDSGKAFFIDFGYDFVTGMAAGWDRAARRPWLYTLPALKRDFGVTTVSAAIPTHYHDDHVAGLNLLHAVEGTEVWAAANFAPVLENPAAYDLPCLWYDPIHVDRVLPLDAPVQWEEYTITLHAQPGHTFYAVAITFEADGKRFLCSGDQYAGDGADVFDNYVYQNEFRPGDYALSAKLYRRVNPDYILTGHWLPYRVQPDYLDRLAAQGAALARLHADLLPTIGYDPAAPARVAWLRPYQVDATGGERVTITAEVRNPLGEAADVTLVPVVPVGWTVDAPELHAQLAAGETGCVQFDVTPPVGPAVRRARIAVDVTVGGQRLGQLAEALVTVC
jgi:glyoxylase-like metal-dependent hydrolase (beta-lactamase superfamily II)